MQKFDFSYDKEYDDLFLYNPKSNSKGCVEFGDIILDFNAKKELVGVEIMNASKIIKNKIAGVTAKTMLAELVSCRVEAEQKKNMLMIRICLKSKDQDIMQQLLCVPNIKKPSPALAC